MRIIGLICILLVFSFPSLCAAEKTESNLDLKSEAAILLDNDTGAMLFQKNGYEKMYPASLTKIATAIYAIEKGDLSDNVTVSENAYNTEGTKVYLEIGEQVTLEHLLQGMLINSGNDAAVAIAEHIDGSVEQFNKNINSYLKEKVDVHSTNFTNPNGLYDKNHYTTAYDLGIITQYALQNDTFREIFGTKELKWDGLTWNTTLVSHHQMLNGERPYSEVIGGKTGFVDESKQTLVTAAEDNEFSLTAVVLKGTYKRDVYEDTRQLLDYGFQNYKHDYITSNQLYSYNDTNYQLDSNKEITVPLDDGNQEVTSTGMLLIENNSGDILQSIQLDEIAKEQKNVNETLAININSEGEKSGVSLSFVLLAILIVGSFSWIRWMNVKKRT